VMDRVGGRGIVPKKLDVAGACNMGPLVVM
jgi:hypothetical protein